VKELLKSDSICQSYARVKKGPVFVIHSVVTADFTFSLQQLKKHVLQHRD